MRTRTPFVDASQPQHTAAGFLLGRMYYSGFLEKVLDHGTYSGYPHNGGTHTLYLRMAKEDIQAFLELVLETFPKNEGALPFVESVKKQLH